jgi:peptide chain release factor 2
VQIAVKSKANAARQWANALAKMYLGWAKQRRLAAGLLGEDQSPDGRSYSVTLVISGFGVYGLLQGESGAHRLTQLVKTHGGEESLQRLSAAVVVLPELSDDELPAAEIEVNVKGINRSGLLIPHWTTLVTARRADKRIVLAGNLPADDLAAEAARLLRTSLHMESLGPEAQAAPPPGGIVRSYTRSTKDKGVHDHRTGQRTRRVKQVLEGEIQEFLDEALKQRRGSK